MKKIACIGVITADVITRTVNEMPPYGTLKFVEENSIYLGGCAANAAAALAKLGIPVSLTCKVGADSFGDFAKNELERLGVATDHIISDPSVTTSSSVVLINGAGERTFLHNPSSNNALREAEISDEILNEADIIFIAGTFLMKSFDGAPCAALLQRAKASGKYTVLDTAWDPTGRWFETLKPCLPLLDLFMPSYEEAVQLSNEYEPEKIAEFFISLSVKNAVIKLGKKGCYVRGQNGDSFYTPTYDFIKALDTTGAGDSFCAGFLAALSMGWDFKECTKLGNAVGTHCITAAGASAGIKSLEETLEFMKNNELS